jgi:hypothetical protein
MFGEQLNGSAINGDRSVWAVAQMRRQSTVEYHHLGTQEGPQTGTEANRTEQRMASGVVTPDQGGHRLELDLNKLQGSKLWSLGVVSTLAGGDRSCN